MLGKAAQCVQHRDTVKVDHPGEAAVTWLTFREPLKLELYYVMWPHSTCDQTETRDTPCVTWMSATGMQSWGRTAIADKWRGIRHRLNSRLDWSWQLDNGVTSHSNFSHRPVLGSLLKLSVDRVVIWCVWPCVVRRMGCLFLITF